ADRLLELGVQALVILEANAGGAEGNELGAAAVEVAVGNEVRGDDVALDLAVVDLDLLEAERGGGLPADVEDLDEFAVLEGDRGRWGVDEPAAEGGSDRHQEQPRRHGPAPPTATLFASFLHRQNSKGMEPGSEPGGVVAGPPHLRPGHYPLSVS